MVFNLLNTRYAQIICLILFLSASGFGADKNHLNAGRIVVYTDTIPLIDRKGDFLTDKNKNPFDITPKILEQKVEYDIQTGKYIVYEKIGDEYYRTPTYLTFEEYLEWKSKEQESEYFKNLAGIQAKKKTDRSALDPMSKIDISKSLVDRMFGGTEVNVKPQGGIDLTLGFFSYYRTFPTFGSTSPWNPLDPVDLKPRLTVDGNVGTKMKLNFNYDAQSSFDFDKKIKLQYDSDAFSEDDIIKKIELGNVSLPLKGSLIQGAQSLMGAKVDMQFGHLRTTLLASQQLSKQNNIKIENGASIQEFDITPIEYDENRHFFLSHFNRESYEGALSNLPQINTSFRISQIEVWISDDRPDYQTGQSNIVAIADLAEGDLQKYNRPLTTMFPPKVITDPKLLDPNGKPLPDNDVNGIYNKLITGDTLNDLDKAATILKAFGMEESTDFDKFRGRLLNSSEYTYHPQLGYISLNLRLRPNQVLGVAYKYFYTLSCDSIFSVGQTAGQGLSTTERRSSTSSGERDTLSSKVLFVKLLKPRNQQASLPSWDLMMKNVYNLRTSQLNKDGFQFDIYYEDDFNDGSLKKFIPETNLNKIPLLNLFRLDNLNKFNDPQADGVFDYVPGVTVIERTGSIIFPVLEPFGSSLKKLFNNDSTLVAKYTYSALYDTTVTIATHNHADKNKFRLIGKVKSNTTGEINLGPFVPRDGVRVTAGGITLQEGSDYEIDYSLGKLRILNPAYLAQGTPINVNYEDQSAFSSLNKSMIGARFDYDFSKKFTMGATYLRLKERPYTQKVNIGDDPINNRIIGLDLSYSEKTPWITNLLDKLPFYSTKEESSFNLTAEAAYLKPGHNKVIDSQKDKKDDGGVVNIDDFEGAVSGFTLGGFNTNSWILCSTPPEFKESTLSNNLAYGSNRAKISWYQVDQSVNSSGPDRNNPYSRLVLQTDLFDRTAQTGLNQLFTFDVSYYPEDRGPYNFDLPNGRPPYSQGTRIVGNEIKLEAPKTRWGGMMRYFPNSDFEANNYQFIEFWVLNPFINQTDSEEGEIVFHLGNVSEDVLRDNQQFFENAVDTSGLNPSVRSTVWGDIPVKLPLVNGFVLNNIKKQDLGFDGLNDPQERVKYDDYLNEYATIKTQLSIDPCGDNFLFYNDKSIDTFPMVRRMRDFSSPQGNTPDQSNFDDNRFYRGSRTPDSEDLNNNRSLDQGESYYEYRLKIKNNNGEIDTASTPFYKQFTIARNNEKWYRFVIPINRYNTAEGGISGFRSIQFMRMYFTQFEKQKTFRFADFQLVRNQWRNSPFTACKDGIPVLSVEEVGVQENGKRKPIPYVRPNGIQEEILNNSLGTQIIQDEKSLAINFCNLQPGCEVAINKFTKLDLNLYEKLQMWVHAESSRLDASFDHGDLSIYIKLGKDLSTNYYEYVMPLQATMFGDTSNHLVWPDTNLIDIKLKDFLNTKIQKLQGGPLNFDDPENAGASFAIKGLPSLGYIKQIEIGVRNTSKETKTLCGQVWVNELRATGLNEKAAYAAQSKAQIKLADLGDINLAASYSSIGFGSLDQKLIERSRDEIKQFDVSTSLQLGKLLPKFLPINLPFFAQYTKNTRTSQFDPYQQDLKVSELLNAVENIATDEEKEEIKDRSREVATIKSYNFTNVRKEGGSGKGSGKPWSLENISGSYSFTEAEKRDAIIESDKTIERKASLDYGFSNKPKYIQPLKFIKPKALKLLSEFNFSLLPTNFGFNTTMERYVNNKTFRLPDIPVFRFDDQRFKWDRNYTLDWNLTKALSFNFRANTTSVVDEYRQTGIENNPDDRSWVDEKGKDVSALVRADRAAVNAYRNANLKNFGRAKNYSHNIGLNYKLPISLLPLMDWTTGNAEYKSTYSWTAGPLIFIDELYTNDPVNHSEVDSRPGNIIQNTQNRTVNATLSFDKLYSKWSYLKKIEAGGKAKPKSNRKKDEEKSDGTGKGSNDKKSNSGDGDNDSIDSKSDKNIESKEKEEGAAGDKKGGKENKSGDLKEVKDKRNKESKEDKKEKQKDRVPTLAERIIIRPLLTLRSAKFTYKEDFGTILPGFKPEAELFGLSKGFGDPGWQFAAGLQPDLDKSNANNYLRQNQNNFSPSPNFNEQILQTRRLNMNAKIALEPFKDFKIDVDFNKDYRNSHTEIFKNKISASGNEFMQIARLDGGSFEATFASFNTLFDNPTDLMAKFLANRAIISNRLPNITTVDHPDYPGYAYGQGPSSFAVVVPAFLAAYRGVDENTISLDLRNEVKAYKFVPKPNWILRYDGLSKLNMFKNILTSFSLKHGYKSTMTVSNFITQSEYRDYDPFRTAEGSNNYYSQIEIPALVIKEDFSPLIGIDMKTKNNMEIKFEYKKGRQLDLRAINGELAETLSSSLVFGYGYIIENFKGFGEGKGRAKKESRKKKDDFGLDTKTDEEEDDKNATTDDKKGVKKSKKEKNATNAKGKKLTINCDFSIRDDVSQIYKFNEANPTKSEQARGSKTIQLAPNVEYQMYKNLALRLYFEYNKTNANGTPGAYNNTNMSAGTVVRYTFN